MASDVFIYICARLIQFKPSFDAIKSADPILIMYVMPKLL